MAEAIKCLDVRSWAVQKAKCHNSEILQSRRKALPGHLRTEPHKTVRKMFFIFYQQSRKVREESFIKTENGWKDAGPWYNLGMCFNHFLKLTGLGFEHGLILKQHS